MLLPNRPAPYQLPVSGATVLGWFPMEAMPIVLVWIEGIEDMDRGWYEPGAAENDTIPLTFYAGEKEFCQWTYISTNIPPIQWEAGEGSVVLPIPNEVPE